MAALSNKKFRAKIQRIKDGKFVEQSAASKVDQLAYRIFKQRRYIKLLIISNISLLILLFFAIHKMR